jgi:hypothetical protein
VAYNSIGSGVISDSISIMAAVAPDAPSQPTLESQSKTQIGIKWDDPLDDGGSPLTEYVVQMAMGASPLESAYS